MNWNPSNWLEAVGLRVLALGELVTGRRLSNEVQRRVIEADREGLVTALEALDLADQVDFKDAADEYRKAIVDAFKAGVVETTKLTRQMTNGHIATGEGMSELADPFGPSGSSAMPIENGSKAVAPPIGSQRALPEPKTQDPPKRGRGRPKGSKTRKETPTVDEPTPGRLEP